MTSTARKLLLLGTVMATMAFTQAMAQETTPTQAPAVEQPAAGAPVGTGADLPFINNGANQPVLQTISPDGQAIAPNEMPAPEGLAAEGHEAAGAEHGGAEHGGEHKQGLPQFDSTTFSKQIFWLVLTFAFLYLVYSKFTIPGIASVIERRENKILADIREAESLKTEIERVRGEYEAAIAAAQTDAQKLIANVQADIKRLAETQDATFKARAEEAMNAIEKKVATDRTRVVAELDTLAASLASDIATRLAGIKPDASAAQDAVNSANGKAKAA